MREKKKNGGISSRGICECYSLVTKTLLKESVCAVSYKGKRERKAILLSPTCFPTLQRIPVFTEESKVANIKAFSWLKCLTPYRKMWHVDWTWYFWILLGIRTAQPTCHTHSNINISSILAFCVHCKIWLTKGFSMLFLLGKHSKIQCSSEFCNIPIAGRYQLFSREDFP